MQEAEDIDTGVDTRTKEEMLADQMKGLSSAGKTAVESIPGVGEAIVAKEIAEDISAGDYLSAGIGTAALGVGLLPAGDILNKPLRAAAKKLRKVDKDAATKMLSDVDSIETWKKQNPNPKPQKQNPDVEKSANDLLEGKITGKQHRSVVKENMPIVKIDEVPEMPSFTEIVGALDKDKSAKGILGLNKSVKDGTRVSSRLDIPAYERFDKWVVSVHDAFDKKGRESLNGDIVGYGKTAILKNVDFKGLPQGAANIAAKRNPKGTIARIFGDYYNAEPENVAEYARQVIKDKNWTQVGYNPFRHGFFYDKDTGMPVKSAEEVIQVGPLVLAKNAQKIKISEAKQVGPKGGIKIRAGKPIKGLQNLKETKTVFNEGGAVMQKQMSMFDEGGLMDEGGTVDPVSGNDVPPGSTQEEVRDDIPAQLSEGEFVFPADVVRYIGLGNLMRIRQEAKMGLKMMDEMGQMGNSEEATMPDDLPFDINDLDMEDDDEYNTPQEFAVGGMPTPNPDTGVYYNPAATPTTGVATAPTQAASQQFVQQTAVPTMQAYKPSEVPTFQQTIGDDAFGSYDELRQYKNEAGNIINVPFRNGQPISPIPEGYTFVDPEATETEEVTTTPTTPQTTTVREEPGGDEPPGDTQYSTTDATGIGYDRSKLTDNMRDIISEYGAGFGTLMETFGKASIPGAIASAFDKDPRVATNSVTSGSLGGVFDAFRGVTDRSGGRFQNQKSYENTTELHNLPAWQQDRLATVAGTTMKEMESFFKDKKGKGISNDKASKNMINALASRFGLTQNQINEIANKGGSFNQTTKLARALSEKIAAENLAKERAAENEREQERAALDAATADKRKQDRIDTGGQGPGNPKTGGDEGGFTDTGPGGTGQDVGVDESTGFSTGYSDDGYNQGGLASKPKPKTKKMKKGGLASKK